MSDSYVVTFKDEPVEIRDKGTSGCSMCNWHLLDEDGNDLDGMGSLNSLIENMMNNQYYGAGPFVIVPVVGT